MATLDTGATYVSKAMPVTLEAWIDAVHTALAVSKNGTAVGIEIEKRVDVGGETKSNACLSLQTC